MKFCKKPGLINSISNVSFNLPYRKIISLTLAVLAMNAGMDSAVAFAARKSHKTQSAQTEIGLRALRFCHEK